ncbi:MAG: methyltransferase domain-containing protein, partial [Bacteroidetes bacterium]|nr:methyltransferase domain-containing protein [Bacteroidota bacterium]
DINGKNATNCGMGKVYWKRWLSYIWPIREQGFSSKKNPDLELRWENGALVLNSAHANYSYGSLHEVMRQAIAYLSKEELKNLLLLGLGGGSALQLAKQKCGDFIKATAVDFDPTILDIAKSYFKIHEYSWVQLVQADACTWVESAADDSFTAIIDDLFVNLEKPDFVLNPNYIGNLHRILQPGGILIINLMAFQESDFELFSETYCARFLIEHVQRVHEHNRLLFLRKVV